MSLVPPPVSCHQPWAAGWAPLPQQAFLEWKEQKRGSKSCFLPLCPRSSYCTTSREQAAPPPPSLCTATAPCLSGCWTAAASHSPGLVASHRAVQGMEAWCRAMQPRDGPHHFPVHSSFHQNLPLWGLPGWEGELGGLWMESALRRGLAPALGSSL